MAAELIRGRELLAAEGGKVDEGVVVGARGESRELEPEAAKCVVERWRRCGSLIGDGNIWHVFYGFPGAVDGAALVARYLGDE